MSGFESIFSFVVQILGYGGASAAIAYCVMRFFGKKWLENQFAKSLEEHKHKNAIELQSLKIEIDGALDATIRLQGREFEVLTQVWDLMNEAFGRVASFVNPFQEYQDMSRMIEKAKLEYLATLDIGNATKDEILAASDQQAQLVETIFWVKRNKAGKHVESFHNYIIKNEVFINEELAEKFKEVSTHMQNALTEHEIMHYENSTASRREAWKISSETIAPLVEEIKRMLREKLHKIRKLS